MTRTLLVCSLLVLVAPLGHAQNQLVTLPQGTQLPVSIESNLPMKVGLAIRAELLYPVYVQDQLVLPAKTAVAGTVVALNADHSRRVQARLRGDFTPFHTPVVRFDSLLLPDGKSIAITTGTATDGAPVYRLVAPPPRKGGLIAKEFGDLKRFAADRVRVATGPDKGDRLKQLIYSQLPYHPERIVKGTAWTVETVSPVTFTAAPVAIAASTAGAASAATSDGPPTWILQGYLLDAMSSAHSKSGEMIHATVAEPVLNPDGSIAVPEGSVLSGIVTQARPARRLGRAGELRFSFRQLTLPGGQPESIRASLRGVDSSSPSQLAMDSEGDVKPKPQDKLLVPLILLSLAGRPLDHDGGRHQFGKDAAGSNAVGLLGFIIGTAARQPNLAAGIGYYGAALAIWNRVFSRGKEVEFAKNTRVILQTTATRSAALKP